MQPRREEFVADFKGNIFPLKIVMDYRSHVSILYEKKFQEIDKRISITVCPRTRRLIHNMKTVVRIVGYKFYFLFEIQRSPCIDGIYCHSKQTFVARN